MYVLCVSVREGQCVRTYLSVYEAGCCHMYVNSYMKSSVKFTTSLFFSLCLLPLPSFLFPLFYFPLIPSSNPLRTRDDDDDDEEEEEKNEEEGKGEGNLYEPADRPGNKQSFYISYTYTYT